jgi:HPr Serine kinase C-terminal domain
MGAVSAFGLDIAADRPLPFLAAAGPPSGRPLELNLAPAAEPGWPAGELICDERRRGGEVEFQIEAMPDGYEIRGPAYGVCRIAADARRIWGRPGEGGMVGWQRLLIAQTLPFTAVLRGLEVFHAAAVAVDGEGVALSGPSGTGKTSLALALARRGAALLADDVLAVELGGGGLLAHPGAAVAGIDRAEAARLRERGSWDGGGVVGENEREILVRISPSRRPRPLTALFVLERRVGAGPPRFEPAADARLLLASTFNLLLASPRRLTAQLEICAELARRRVERLVFGPGSGPDELAELVLERLGEGR